METNSSNSVDPTVVEEIQAIGLKFELAAAKARRGYYRRRFLIPLQTLRRMFLRNPGRISSRRRRLR